MALPPVGPEFLRSQLKGISADDALARAAQAGRTPRFRSPEFYVWQIRLAVERGIVRPHPVSTVALVGVDFPTEKTWAGFSLLLGCKWLYEPGVPTVFGREFAGPWCGVSVKQARDGITALARMGLMVRAGWHGRATTWLPRGVTE